MIHSGRKTISSDSNSNKRLAIDLSYRRARLTAILGSLIFAAFLCISVLPKDDPLILPGGVVQVISPNNGSTACDGDSLGEDLHASAKDDSSLWAYFESLLRHILLGE